MSNVHAVSTAQAINLLILAHLSQNLDRIATSYGNLEWALAQDDTESCTCRAIDIPAADPTRDIRPTSSTHWQTKDCAMLHTDKIYALWYCDSITQEILRVNGRVTPDGKLAELAGMDSASIDIGELYFWRVNLLKDELAAQSTSTAVEVEYSDNAEIDTETSPEYD